MQIVKELSSISLPISEPEYRQLPELSYSTLSTYESLGFNGLDHLFDRKESPSLTLGSCVDAIITGGEEEFNNLFFVADFPSIGDKELQIVNHLFDNYSSNYVRLDVIPATYILDAANTFEFQKNWKDDTRIRVVTERCSLYYSLKYEAGSKTIISRDTYNDVLNCVNALRESPATRGYFAPDDELSPIRRYYQLKFKARFGGVGYRCMADELIVDYDKKVIYPIDLKTSLGCLEWDFQQNFKKWHYYIQARLYWRLIKANIEADSYFKDFTLEDYRFIIVNPKSLTPLVWKFPLTKSKGTLIDDDGNEIRDPFDIGQELQLYLNMRPKVPNGINLESINTIECIKLP